MRLLFVDSRPTSISPSCSRENILCCRFTNIFLPSGADSVFIKILEILIYYHDYYLILDASSSKIVGRLPRFASTK